MKIKSVLLFVCILLFPFMVFAEDNVIQIKSISMVDHSDGVFEKDEISYEGGDIYLNLQMNEVGNFVEYLMVLKNTANEDLKMTISSSSPSDYLQYSLTSKEGNHILKKGKEEEFILRVEYINQVPNSVYTISDELEDSINLGVVMKSLKNPKTGWHYFWFILPILMLVTGLLSIRKQKNVSKYYFIILGLSFIIPNIVFAEKSDITIHSNVTIANYSYVYTINAGTWNSQTSQFDDVAWIEEPLPSQIEYFYTTEEVFRQLDEMQRDYVFLRYKVNSHNIVTSSYVGFVYQGNIYYLQGTMATYDFDNDYYNDSPYYDENKSVLNNVIGSSNCMESVEENYRSYSCPMAQMLISIDSIGGVLVEHNSWSCSTAIEGYSNCYVVAAV